MASNDVNTLVKLTAGKNPLYFFAAICRLPVLAIFGPLGGARDRFRMTCLARAESTYLLGSCRINCSFDG
jgi:hypothetical protein